MKTILGNIGLWSAASVITLVVVGCVYYVIVIRPVFIWQSCIERASVVVVNGRAYERYPAVQDRVTAECMRESHPIFILPKKE